LLEIKANAASYQTLITIHNLSTGIDQKYFVVPNGLGGTQEGEVILLSEKTPLAKNILGRKAGSEFELNGQKLRIKKIEGNL
jgi:transcription elongation GreA/GreB family factor